MNRDAVLHKGLLLDCKVCNPPTETQEKRERRKRRGPLTLDMVVRRQVAADLGEEEPKKDERFQLLQKYGVAAPRIDRLMTKPNWMGVAEWKRKLNEWYKSTKGLVAPQQRRTGRYESKASEVRRGGVWQGASRQGKVHSTLQESVESDSKRPGFQRRQTSSRPIWNNPRRETQSSRPAGRDVRSVPQTNLKIGDRP